jgi:probable phosphoglycerate mutase
MSEALPQIYLARHGETAWSITGQHTGRTDIPLTPSGERNAVLLGERLKDLTFDAVYTSPLQRASKTCELAGFGAVAKKDPDLMEWHYGDYEGLTTADIQKDRPGWNVFCDGCPGGETIEEVAARAQRVVARLRATTVSKVLLFSHGHFLRFIAASWLGLPMMDARFFSLRPTSLSILAYEHNLNEPVIRLWNDDGHIEKI